MENELEIDIKKLNPNAKTPSVNADNDRLLDVYAAEDVYIAPGETETVSTGLAFIFPNDIGLMIIPISGLRESAFLRYPQRAFVLQNNYYSGEEVKIYLQNMYPGKDPGHKVPEYKLIDGTVITDHNNFYEKETVKICKGDCIARMMLVDAFYLDIDDVPKKLVKK